MGADHTIEQANIARTDAEYEKWKGTADKADSMNGICQGWEELARTVGDTMGQVSNITMQALDGMADQLANFVMTGKADFRSLTLSILSDISKMMILNAVKAAFGGFFGGGLVGSTEVNDNATYGMGTWATGNGSKYEPAGIVHKGEYVITKEATARLRRGFLDQLNYGGSTGYATGGLVGGSSTVLTLPNNAQASLRVKSFSLFSCWGNSFTYLLAGIIKLSRASARLIPSLPYLPIVSVSRLPLIR